MDQNETLIDDTSAAPLEITIDDAPGASDDAERPEATYHVTVNGIPACEAFPGEPCEFYTRDMAREFARDYSARLITSEVDIITGPCPNTGLIARSVR